MNGFKQAQAEYESRMDDPYWDEDIDPDEWLDKDAYFSELAMERQLMEEEKQVESYCWG